MYITADPNLVGSIRQRHPSASLPARTWAKGSPNTEKFIQQKQEQILSFHEDITTMDEDVSHSRPKNAWDFLWNEPCLETSSCDIESLAKNLTIYIIYINIHYYRFLIPISVTIPYCSAKLPHDAEWNTKVKPQKTNAVPSLSSAASPPKPSGILFLIRRRYISKL